MMDKAEFDNELKVLNASIKKLRDEAAEKSRAFFHKETTEFFAAVPEIKSIVWSQYTPFFADGDVCEFGVNDPAFLGESQDPYGEKYYDDEENPFTKPSRWTYERARANNKSDNVSRECIAQIEAYDKLREEMGAEKFDGISNRIDAMKQVFASIDNDYMQMMFGDHVLVVATAEGFDINEYDHD